MRARVSWMNEVDDAILEYLQELETDTGHRIALPPTAVWYNLVEELSVLDRSQNTVSRRMNVLSEGDCSRRPMRNAVTTGSRIVDSHILRVDYI